MTRKDRIAVVVSTALCIPAVLMVLAGKPEGALLLFVPPLLLYWGYRFIQNDISFLKVKDD